MNPIHENLNIIDEWYLVYDSTNPYRLHLFPSFYVSPTFSFPISFHTFFNLVYGNYGLKLCQFFPPNKLFDWQTRIVCAQHWMKYRKICPPGGALGYEIFVEKYFLKTRPAIALAIYPRRWNVENYFRPRLRHEFPIDKGESTWSCHMPEGWLVNCAGVVWHLPLQCASVFLCKQGWS